MFLCFKLAPIDCSALIHSTLLSSWLLEQVWNIKTHNLFIFSTEKIPQNSEPQNGPRRGLDFIALFWTTTMSWILWLAHNVDLGDENDWKLFPYFSFPYYIYLHEFLHNSNLIWFGKILVKVLDLKMFDLNYFCYSNCR